MIRIESSVTINRPLGEVWGYLSKLENYPIWQSSIEEVSATDELNTGSEIRCVAHNFGKRFSFVAHVVENDGKSRFKVISQTGPINFESNYQLTDLPAGTKLTVKTEGEISLALKLAEPLLRQASQTRQEANLKILKTILENQPQPAV